MNSKKLFLIFCFSFSTAQNDIQFIDGVAAVVENHVILKSDLAQMVNMTAIQRRIDLNNLDAFLQLQGSVIQSMIDQKILLEMAEVDSITVEEKDVNQSLDQQVEMLINQAGNKERAEEILGQSIKSFRREFWYDMKDRMISERYQQQLLGSVAITRPDVKEFYNTYRDSLPYLPMKVKIRHLLISVKPGDLAKNKIKDVYSIYNRRQHIGFSNGKISFHKQLFL